MLSRAQKILSGWSSNSVTAIDKAYQKIVAKHSNPNTDLDSKHFNSKDPHSKGSDSNNNDETSPAEITDTELQGDNHLSIAKESLNYLLNDKRVPPQVRDALSDDFQQIEQMLKKIEHEHIHISVLGRVSVGKSSLLNALMGQEQFSTSPLHGETKTNSFANWSEYEEGGVYFIDTPGINEIEGEQRAKMAHEVASRSDIILFVLDSDMTDTEYQALKQVVYP